MGREFWVGIALLAVLLLLTGGMSFAMNTIHQPAQEQLIQAAELALAGDLPQAAELARQAGTRWERFRKMISAVADHSPMDEIDRLFAEAEVMAAAEEIDQFAACCGQLRVLVEGMADAHSAAWWNLL